MKVEKKILEPLRADVPLHQMSTDTLLMLAQDKHSSRRRELAEFVCSRADAYDELGTDYPTWLSASLYYLSDKLEEIAKEAMKDLRRQRGN